MQQLCVIIKSIQQGKKFLWPKSRWKIFCKKFHVQSRPILSRVKYLRFCFRKSRPAPSRVTFLVLNITLTNLTERCRGVTNLERSICNQSLGHVSKPDRRVVASIFPHQLQTTIFHQKNFPHITWCKLTRFSHSVVKKFTACMNLAQNHISSSENSILGIQPQLYHKCSLSLLRVGSYPECGIPTARIWISHLYKNLHQKGLRPIDYNQSDKSECDMCDKPSLVRFPNTLSCQGGSL